MLEEFQNLAVTYLPELIITTVSAPLIVGALCFIPCLLMLIYQSRSERAYTVFVALTFIGIATFVVYLFTPNYYKVAEFSKAFPQHEDSSHYSNALMHRDLTRLTALNKKWSKYLVGTELIELWKLISLLPDNHYLRDDFRFAVRHGVISYQEYESIASALVASNLQQCALLDQTIIPKKCASL